MIFEIDTHLYELYISIVCTLKILNVDVKDIFDFKEPLWSILYFI